MFYLFVLLFLFIPFVCNILTSWPATRLRCGLKREINANSRTHEFAKANLPKLTFWLTDMDKFELSNQWLLVDLPSTESIALGSWLLDLSNPLLGEIDRQGQKIR